MDVQETDLPGVLVVEPRVLSDPRGFFIETWQRNRYEAAGLPGEFVQVNLSRSGQGVLRDSPATTGGNCTCQRASPMASA
jgi:dTDP-4-dehydrorhamnose 3,5-epimerase